MDEYISVTTRPPKFRLVHQCEATKWLNANPILAVGVSKLFSILNCNSLLNRVLNKNFVIDG